MLEAWKALRGNPGPMTFEKFALAYLATQFLLESGTLLTKAKSE
jgi:hypothetical protein